MRKLLVSVLAVLLVGGVASADAFELVATEDGMIHASNPDTNYATQMTHSIAGRPAANAMLMTWGNLPFGLDATSDAVLRVRCVWKEGSLPIGLYELTGGSFTRDSLTFNNYVGAGGLIADVLGDMLLSYDGPSAWWEFTVPQATVQKLLNGEIDGLALWSVPGAWSNHSLKPTASDNPITLSFTAVPEPATLSLLGLGGLALIRRRR